MTEKRDRTQEETEEVVELSKTNYEDRFILINENINSKSIEQAILTIRKVNAEDDEKEKDKYKDSDGMTLKCFVRDTELEFVPDAGEHSATITATNKNSRLYSLDALEYFTNLSMFSNLSNNFSTVSIV